jgi:hypothetical protein
MSYPGSSAVLATIRTVGAPLPKRVGHVLTQAEHAESSHNERCAVEALCG